ESLLESDDAELRSDALGLRSRVCWLSGRWVEALSSANAAVAALAGLPESPQLARALARRSQVEMLKQRPEAVDHAREAIAVARRVGDSFAEPDAAGHPLPPGGGRRNSTEAGRDRVDRRRDGGSGRVRGGLPGHHQLHLVRERLS